MKKKLLTMLFVVVLVLAVMSIAFVGCKKDKPEITLSGITVSYSGSENLDFGTQLDKANLAVKAIMSDNSEVNVDVSAFEISGFNPSQLGEQTVTVSYQGKSATFKVTVIKTLQSISASYKGEQLYVGDELSNADIEVKAHYSDNSDEDVESFEVSGFSSEAAGNKELTISALGKECNLSVNVLANNVESLEASYKGDDLFVGDDLDKADIEVRANYSDGSNEVITEFELSGYNAEVAGEQTLSISFGGKSIELKVNVTEVILQSIEASYEGENIYEGDELDEDGISVIAHYNNGDKDISDFDVEGFDGENPGEQSLIISFGGKSYELKINVIALEVEGILASINKGVLIREGGEIAFSDLTIDAYFNNGDKKTLKAEDEEDVSLSLDEDEDFDSFGDKHLNIDYTFRGDVVGTSLNLHVYGSVESIKAEYIGGIKTIGSYLFEADVKVLATYNDGIEDELVVASDKAYSFSGFDSSEAGTCTVTVSYKAGEGVATANIQVEISEPDPNAYTLHDYMGAAPKNFNPHSWETNADNAISGYAEMAFVDVDIAEDGVNFKWVLEMAESITDVTSEYEGQELGGKAIVPQGVTEGQVYRIALNKNAKWENGEAINADTYVESMKALLDPHMQNYRANTYYNGDTALKNAAAYFNAEAPIYAPCVPAYDTDKGEEPDYSFDLSSNPYFIKLAAGTTFAGPTYTISYLHANYGAVSDEIYDELSKRANAYGYIEVNDETFDMVIEALDDCCSLFGLSMYDDDGVVEDSLKEWCFYFTGKYSDPYAWENVGLKKVDDYTIDYILEDATSEFYFYTGMTSNWIVYLPMYNSLKDTSGELVTTTYGTSKETYMSYGPYKLATFQKDRQLTFEKNPNWYGWSDGKHEGQYQTTNIVIDVISNEATIENLFLAGQLDSLGLNATQLARYRSSANLLKTDQTYTFRFIFATDKKALADLEKVYNAGTNLKILSYKDFRKALSLAIDRAEFAAQATGGYKPAYSLFSSLYYYDIENDSNSIYRNTDVAMQTVCDLYNVEYGPGKAYATLKDAYNSITGLNVSQAKALFTQAYEAAKAAGDYTDGQNIVIHCICSAAQEMSEDDTMQQNLLNKYVAAATEGTPLAGKISFEFKSVAGGASRYDEVAAGKIEMIRGAWGGAAFYPFSTIRVYTNPTYMGGLNKIHESCGWNPSSEMLTLTYDFTGEGEETLTLSLENWSNTINGGVKNNDGSYAVPNFSNPDAKLYILSKLEKAVLESYQCIPWATETACSLFSHKIHYATLNYNIMYGYGGIRRMTYNYNDGQWIQYVKEKGGTLSY